MAKITDPSATELPIAKPSGQVVQFPSGGPTGAAAKGLEVLGNQIGVASDELYRAHQIEQERLDNAKVEDAWNHYKTNALDVTNGDKGVLKLRSGAAVDGNIIQTTQENLAAARKKISGALDNDLQRMRFSERADATDLSTNHQVLVHLDTETHRYQEDVMNGSKAAAKSQIVADPVSVLVFAQAKDSLLKQADAFLKSHGVTDEHAIKGYKDSVSDELWETRIETLLYNKPALADGLFRQFNGEIHNEKLKLKLQGETREAGLGVIASNDAQSFIDDYRNRVPPAEAGGDIGRAQQNIAFLQGAIENAATEDAKYTLQHELETETARLDGLRKTSSNPAAQNTNGLPSSRDVAAQLPLIMLRVEKRANELYGTDQGNPDRAAYIRRTTAEVHSKLAADVQQLNAIQRQAQGTLIDAVTGVMPAGPDAQPGMVRTGGQGRAGAPGALITSFSQIQQNPTLLGAWNMLDPQQKLGLERLMEHNLRVNDQGDEKYYRELWNRIHLEPGDPQKIDFYKQITDPTVADRLSIPQIRELRAEIDRAETPGGRSIAQMRRFADTKVEQFFRTNNMFIAQPDRQIAATMRWNEDVGRKVDEYVAAKKDVRSLFMLDTPDSMVSQKFLQTYVNSTPAQGLASQASQVASGQQQPLASQARAPAEPPATIDTREKLDAWMKTLPPEVTTFKGADGRTYRIPADIRSNPNLRPDGTPKGQGFFGPLSVPGANSIATEYSVGVQIGGKQMDIPSLVPTLTRAEVDQVLQAAAAGQHPPEPIIKKAQAYAESRIKAGKPVFAQAGEQTPIPAATQVMTETGKITDAPAEIAMPQLVTKISRAKADENFPTWGDVGTRAASAVEKTVDVGVSAARKTGEAVVQGTTRAAEAVTPPSDADKAVMAFRGFLRSGQFTKASAPTIEQAIGTGQLTGPELVLARRMLREIGK
jgi:hypothetical protein